MSVLCVVSWGGTLRDFLIGSRITSIVGYEIIMWARNAKERNNWIIRHCRPVYIDQWGTKLRQKRNLIKRKGRRTLYNDPAEGLRSADRKGEKSWRVEGNWIRRIVGHRWTMKKDTLEDIRRDDNSVRPLGGSSEKARVEPFIQIWILI